MEILKTTGSREELKIGIIIGHPTQFEGPFYQYFEQTKPGVLEVIYIENDNMENVYDPELDMKINWGLDLLSGYKYFIIPGKRWIRWMREKIKEARYDLFIINGYRRKHFIWSMFLGWLNKTPLALRLDTVEFSDSSKLKSIVKKLMFILFKKIFTHFFVTGTLTKNFLKKMGIKDSMISYFPYAVDNDFFIKRSNLSGEERLDFKRELGIKENDKVIISVAKFNRREFPIDLVKAFIALQETNIQLLLIGEGGLRRELESLANKNPHKKILFTGYVKYTELPKYYGISDLFVHCSINEPWGVSVQEALACGLPVIVSDKVGSGFDLIREGKNGFIYNAGDILMLKEKIESVFKNIERQTLTSENNYILTKWDYNFTIENILKST